MELLKTLSISYELIDTLWNVNEEWGRRMASELRRINRYIMECKLYSMFLFVITNLN